MNALQKTWKTLVKMGAVLFVWSILFIGAISIFSLVNKNTIYYGNRCHSSLDNSAIDYLNQEEIIAFDYELNCNTLYLDLSVNDSLTKNQIIALLTRISNYYNSIDFNTNTQITAKNTSYLILASLANDGGVSLSVSEL